MGLRGFLGGGVSRLALGLCLSLLGAVLALTGTLSTLALSRLLLGVAAGLRLGLILVHGTNLAL